MALNFNALIGNKVEPEITGLNLSALTPKPITKINQPFNEQDFRNRIVYAENRGILQSGGDLYSSVGVTGDVGKYQVNPQSLKEWSSVWLGKEYNVEEFKKDKNAQEEFFNQFIAVAKRLKLTPQQAAVAWHKGWGELGTGEAREVKDKKFLTSLDKRMKQSGEYLNTFNGFDELKFNTEKPVIDTSLKLEQGKVEPKNWYDKLRETAQKIPIIKNVSDILFGIGEEKFTQLTGERPEITTGFASELSLSDQLLTKGLIGTFGVDYFTRTQQEKITLAERQLIKDGATEAQALEISTRWATGSKEEREKLKESLPNNLQKSLKKRETYEGLGILTDAVGILPMGKLTKAGTPALKTFLKGADDIGDISRVLKQAGFADDVIADYAPRLAKTTKVTEIDTLVKAMDKVQSTTMVSETIGESRNLPAVIQGKTFTLGTTETTQPSIKELKKVHKDEIKATKKEIKNAEIAKKKAEKLEAGQKKIRQEAIEKINRFRGNTENIKAELKSKNLSDEDIANIILEDGTKLEDVVKIKRNSDKSLATVITKKEIDDIAKNYTDKISPQKWQKKSMLVDGVEVPIKLARSIELPIIYFERKGLSQISDPIIQAGRDAEKQKQLFLKKFKDAGLFKEGGWLTADRFTLSKNEAKGVSMYYLGRQGKTKAIPLTDLSENSRKFVEIFDSIIKETEERFFETAKKMGKTPGKVENYAPLMTSKDIKLVDEGGAMDWLFRNHPSFFSLKERVKKAPLEVYEMDYREVVARWLQGVTDFLNYGETTNHLKYLVNSDQFKGIVKEQDWQIISKWLQDITTPEKPASTGGQALNSLSKLLRKGTAIGSLGLNYATIVKQALTQIPLSIIEKSPPKLKSEYAKAFGINVADLPSITKRSGDIAISDLQGKIGRVFTGGITKFDRINAQASLNALLDKEYTKFLKEGVDITPETQKLIEKRAQDTLDMWYGGFFKGQRPEAFRKELGNFILMFLYPLTSQLNGFYRAVYKAKGWNKAVVGAEVLASATAIAYLEQVIENLSPQWSDEKGMTQDVLLSLTGNLPVVGNVAYSIVNEKEFNVSPALGNISNIIKNIGQDDKGRVVWNVAETFGLPKQIRRIKEGLEIMEEGGITDNEGKMLAPVQDAMELVRSFLRGKYGSQASQDWVRNIGEKSKNRRWFVTEVEFLQNGDYNRKAELYLEFDEATQKELKEFLSENQQKKLDNAVEKREGLNKIFTKTKNKQPLEAIFK
jgi:hypothetical protein